MATQESSVRGGSLAPWFAIGLLCTIILLGIGLVRFRPDLILGTAANDAAHADPTMRPTSTGAQRQAAQQQSGATAAESQSLQQAAPVEDVRKPPRLPVEATAAAISQPSALDSVPASSLSPADLTYRPLPTPTTMLTDAQFADSQASEEQNQINTMLSGLTPAQQMVRVHDAEYSASNP